MKFSNHPSIVEYTHLVIWEGHDPYRLVLRKLADGRWSTDHETMSLSSDGETWAHVDFIFSSFHDSNNAHQAYYDFGERSVRI